ncbi:MAG: hypothetical protein RLZZ301_1107 [Bacteroidota bacterium]
MTYCNQKRHLLNDDGISLLYGNNIASDFVFGPHFYGS